jgi:hypothetical protein
MLLLLFLLFHIIPNTAVVVVDWEGRSTIQST